jgi:hypothetical protein
LELAMVAEQARYRSYLLRLWRVGTADALSWRASLEDVWSRERHKGLAENKLAGGDHSA